LHAYTRLQYLRPPAPFPLGRAKRPALFRCDKYELVGPEHIPNAATTFLTKFVQHPLVRLVVDYADHGARPTTIFFLNVVGHPVAPCRPAVVADFVAHLELGRHTGTGFFLRFAVGPTGASSRQCEHWRHWENQLSMSRSMNS